MFFELLLFLRPVKCWQTRGKEYGDDAKVCHQTGRTSGSCPSCSCLPPTQLTHPFRVQKPHPLTITTLPILWRFLLFPSLCSWEPGMGPYDAERVTMPSALSSLYSQWPLQSPTPTLHRRLKMVSRDSFVGARRENSETKILERMEEELVPRSQ